MDTEIGVDMVEEEGLEVGDFEAVASEAGVAGDRRKMRYSYLASEAFIGRIPLGVLEFLKADE